jgi:hypothetical protein
MSESIIVRYLGFKPGQSTREYSFQVHEAGAARDFTLNIANEAFVSKLARYQDGPDICSHKLQAELAANANHPEETEYLLTPAELDSYRTSRAVKPRSYFSKSSES